jgi:hypothetical protein
VRVTPSARPGPPWAAWLARALWALALLGLPATVWLDRLLRQAGMPELTSLGASSIPLVVATVSAATVGAVLAGRRPRHPVGWLLLGLGLSLSVGNVTFAYTRYGLVARPGALPGAGYLAGFNNGMVIIWLACAGFVLLLTPTGSLPSPRWRWWARVAAAAAVVWLLGSVVDPAPLRPEYPDIGSPLAVPVLAGPLNALVAAAFVVLVALVVAAVSLLARFRRATGLERQQLRWLTFAAALASVAMLVALGTLGTTATNWNLVNLSLGVCAALLPLATGAAILRYRLYDLDPHHQPHAGLRAAHRAAGVGLRAGGAGARPAAAAGLQPGGGRGDPRGRRRVPAARRRIQRAVDRRFNRRRYDAAHTIQAFSARLRQEVDLDTLTGELLAAVEETMQPARASLWLGPR